MTAPGQRAENTQEPCPNRAKVYLKQCEVFRAQPRRSRPRCTRARILFSHPLKLFLLRRKKGGRRLHRPLISRAERLGGLFADAKTRRAAKDCASDDHASRHAAYRKG